MIRLHYILSSLIFDPLNFQKILKVILTILLTVGFKIKNTVEKRQNQLILIRERKFNFKIFQN